MVRAKKLLISTAIFSILAIVLIMGITFWEMGQLRAANEWVRHSHEVIETTDELNQNILILETKLRAYLLTGQERYIEEISENNRKIYNLLAVVELLTEDNAEQHMRIQSYNNLIVERIQLAENLIKNLQDKVEKKTVMQDEIENGSSITNSIQLLNNEIIGDEKKLLKVRNDVALTNSKRIELYVGVATLFSIITMVVGLLLLLKQIKLRSKAEKKLKHMAYHDPLTGLMNRAYLEEKIDEAIQAASRHSEEIAIVFIDLDNFKPINDKFGHQAGDLVLQVLAKRLMDNIRGNDIITRLGGDEFVVILSGVHKNEDAEIALKKIIKIIEEDICFKTHTITLSASIGISLYPLNGKNAKELLANADRAMYRVKSRGGKNHQFI